MINGVSVCFLYVTMLRGRAQKTTANDGSLNIKLSELDVVFYLCTRPKLVRRLPLSGLIINIILFQLKVTTSFLSASKQDCGSSVLFIFEYERKRVTRVKLL